MIAVSPPSGLSFVLMVAEEVFLGHKTFFCFMSYCDTTELHRTRQFQYTGHCVPDTDTVFYDLASCKWISYQYLTKRWHESKYCQTRFRVGCSKHSHLVNNDPRGGSRQLIIMLINQSCFCCIINLINDRQHFVYRVSSLTRGFVYHTGGGHQTEVAAAHGRPWLLLSQRSMSHDLSGSGRYWWDSGRICCSRRGSPAGGSTRI